ncbi:RNA polymerase II-associated protein 3-like, partial [Trifolium medium]|nr:RNA polymerase II-associated protein 3-like [Trifolium medium]
KVGKSKTKVNGSSSINSVSNVNQKSGPTEAHHQTKINEQKIPAKESLLLEEINNKDTKSGSRTQGQVGNGSKEGYNASNSLEQVKLYLQILRSSRLVM